MDENDEDNKKDEDHEEIKEESGSEGDGEEKKVTFQRKQTAAQQKLANGGKKAVYVLPITFRSSANVIFRPVPIGKYDPIKDGGWAAGQPVPYLALARALSRIEQTSGRLDIIEHLSNLYRSIIELTPEDLILAVYLSTNRVSVTCVT